jgi:hypothetical protein
MFLISNQKYKIMDTPVAYLMYTSKVMLFLLDSFEVV